MALSGNQITRNAPGGAGRGYAGFTAKAATVAIATKSGISRLTSIEAQRTADRQKKRRIVYAVDALQEDTQRKNKADEVALSPATGMKKAVAQKPTPPEPVETSPDTASDILAAIEKSINRRKKKDEVRAILSAKTEEKQIAETRRQAETEEKQRLVAEEKARVEAKAAAIRQAKVEADKAVDLALAPVTRLLADVAILVRNKVTAEVNKVDGISEVEAKAITDASMKNIATNDFLVLAILEIEKRHKKAMMKAMLLTGG